MANLKRHDMKRRHTGHKINQLNRKGKNRKRTINKRPTETMNVWIVSKNPNFVKARQFHNVHVDMVNYDAWHDGRKVVSHRLRRKGKTIGLFPVQAFEVRPWIEPFRKSPKRKKVYYNTYFKRKKSDYKSIPNFWD